MGLSTISKEKIDFIDKAPDEENQSLRKKWRKEEVVQQERLEAKRSALRKFEAEQLSKGLIKYEGEWMTPEKRQEALTLRRRSRENIMQFEDDQRQKGFVRFEHIWVTPKLGDELLAMGKTIQELDGELRLQSARRDSLRNTMLKIPITDTESYDKRIEEIEKISESINKNSRKLEELYRRADDIEAIAVKYDPPEEFRGILPAEGEFR